MGDELARLTQQAPAGRGQRQALGVVAKEELDAQAPFELGEGGGDRGLRYVQSACRPGDPARIGRRNEIAEVLEGEQDRKFLCNSSKFNIFPFLRAWSSWSR